MFSLFKRKKTSISLSDIDDNPIKEGDRVVAMRYDLGECVIGVVEGSVYYESLVSGDRVSWLKMIDATTERQKVRKLPD